MCSYRLVCFGCFVKFSLCLMICCRVCCLWFLAGFLWWLGACWVIAGFVDVECLLFSLLVCMCCLSGLESHLKTLMSSCFLQLWSFSLCSSSNLRICFFMFPRSLVWQWKLKVRSHCTVLCCLLLHRVGIKYVVGAYEFAGVCSVVPTLNCVERVCYVFLVHCWSLWCSNYFLACILMFFSSVIVVNCFAWLRVFFSSSTVNEG